MRIGTQLACGLLLLAACASATPKLKSKSRDNEESDSQPSKDPPRARHHKKQLDDEIDLDSAFELEQLGGKQLPILPPIILLDFVNGTGEASSNATDQADEKSKRTIDSSLGYGFGGNNLFSGKHNYYFPAGETGTAVSIEESISPFEPKTVTEVIKPITEKTDASGDEDERKPHKPLFEALPDPLPLQNREPLPIYPPYPVFGQRTKLQKASAADFDKRPPGKSPYAGPYSTPASPGPAGYNKLLASYMAAKPLGHAALADFVGSANLHRYARPMTSSYLASYMRGKYGGGGQKPAAEAILDPSTSPGGSQEINLADYPKYTIENGVRYEHKIVWKYPDGKISESPPMSYVGPYSEYAGQSQKLGPPTTVGGFRPSLPPHPRPTAAPLPAGYDPYNTRAQSNIYSPRPVQFPDDQEQSNGKQQNEASRFVSAASAGAPQGSDFKVGHSYNLPHQGQYGIKYSPKYANQRPALSYNNQYNNYANHRPSAKYPASGLDAEYAYGQESGQSGNLFSPDGQINKHVLAKYTPEAQSYLTKVFSGKRTPMHEYQGVESGSYANSEFSNLLNYNPSISQYIKNPSSILKAQPTFIQAGSSLIPVIILRVDGSPPIQTKSVSNINLKSLLRQYLTQYANSVSKVSQNTNYDLGGAISESEASIHQSNPVEDLKQLTDTLESLRQRGHQDPDFLLGSYSHNKAQQAFTTQPYNRGAMRDHTMSYSEFVKDYSKISNGQEIKKGQKVKSVQIIEDPRYTSFKVNDMGK